MVSRTCLGACRVFPVATVHTTAYLLDRLQLRGGEHFCELTELIFDTRMSTGILAVPSLVNNAPERLKAYTFLRQTRNIYLGADMVPDDSTAV